MASPFPRRTTVDVEADAARVCALESEEAGEVFGALGSATARAILATFVEEPRTASAVADAVDTSLQNARYHIDRLAAADLIEPVDTWYSAQGTEMTVYGATSESLVVLTDGAGADDPATDERVERAIGALLGAVGAVSAPVSALALLDVLRRVAGVVAVVGLLGLLLEALVVVYERWAPLRAVANGQLMGLPPIERPTIAEALWTSPFRWVLVGGLATSLLLTVAAAVIVRHRRRGRRDRP